jgi:hypothetical protein
VTAGVLANGFAGPGVYGGPCDVTTSPDWKSAIDFPYDSFRNVGNTAALATWVKFTILTCDPTTVYFQDSNAYPFHYQFATERLDPLLGITPAAFDLVTLYEAGQKAVLGAVLIPWLPGSSITEFGIQLVRNDPYDPVEVVDLFNLVRSKVNADPGVQAFYFPTFEQLASAEANRDFLEAQGVPISSLNRWAVGNSCYSTGWALGELKFFEGHLIQGAYLIGMLNPDDILLTDGVPAEIPPLAGVLTLSPSTPNSHVAILAQTFQVPFAHLALGDDAAKAQALVGRRIALRAFPGSVTNCDVRLIDVDGVLTETQIGKILALKEPSLLNIAPTAPYGSYGASTDGLTPSDIQYFGGKASNFGFLRRAIPDASPRAAGISFNLWTEFLGQTLSGGSTLRQEIADRLSAYTYPPANAFALYSDLLAIRNMFTDPLVTTFTAAQQSAVIGVLQDPLYDFDAQKRIRFRSSTNVEDTEQFTGAGLYDSVSGCLADELDGDTIGPSLCDPTKPDERGVFRAIRKVFASFYNDNAVLERLKHGIDEADVGMALLVHHSFPDDIELANGVAALDYWGGRTRSISLVTQTGAISVANPLDGSIPEEVNVQVLSFGMYAALLRGSNLVQLGATVMDWDQEYLDLAELLILAADQYALETGKTAFVLDFEYKKLAAGGAALPAGGLAVKQIREIPQADTTSDMTPFLINEPTEYCTFQGEEADVFANHRLKGRWMLQTESYWMTAENLTQSFYTTADIEYRDGCATDTISGYIDTWPAANYVYLPDDYHTAKASWMFADLWNPTRYELEAFNVGLPVSAAESPLLTIRDTGRYLNGSGTFGKCLFVRAEYARSVPTWDWPGPDTTTMEYVALCPCPKPQIGDMFQERTFTTSEGVVINTSFYWPPVSLDVGGYTAPLARWVETVIEGLTTIPIVLHDWYAQTYRPEHHNFSEHFIFDPFMDPDVPGHLLDELRDKDIRLIHVFEDLQNAEITTYGHDGSCELLESIPAVSQWGLLSLALLILIAGTLVSRRGHVTPV